MAKFLKWEEGFPHTNDEYGYTQTLEGYITPFLNPNFHEDDETRYEWANNKLQFSTNWNWIMLVYKRYISSLNNESQFKQLKNCQNIKNALVNADIDTLWKELLYFIKLN